MCIPCGTIMLIGIRSTHDHKVQVPGRFTLFDDHLLAKTDTYMSQVALFSGSFVCASFWYLLSRTYKRAVEGKGGHH